MNKRKLFDVLKKSMMIMCLSLIVLFCSTVQTEAAAKVVKIKRESTYSMNYEYNTIYGLSSSGKTVWKRNIAKVRGTQCSPVTVKMRGNYLYLIRHRNLYRLNPQTGKTILTKKKLFRYCPASAVMYIDSKGNLYVIGYLSKDLYKVSPKGKLLWKKTLSDKYHWPTKIVQTGSNIRIYYSDGLNYTQAIIRMSDGKVLGYVV